MKKHLFTLTLSSVLAIPAVTHAEFKGGFADIGIHYLDWTSRTTEKSSTKSHKDDFGYLELEGGANFSWGEMYGFFDWENFYNDRHDKPGSEQRYTFKNTNRIYLGDTGFNLYLHAYGTYGSANRVNFHDDMFLYGIGYNFTGSGWYEFDRDATYAAGNGGKEGLNGAVALWWNATSYITTGIQYRYADDKLGEDFYQDAIIYSIKFNF
ncbi:TPA: hypothetical protein QH594_004273 [Escherichia coli]|nr:hypothetical protein [Escherichia coli]